MHRTIIVGSPRENGRSATLASQIFDACIEDCPDDGLSIVSISSLDIKACVGCNRCQEIQELADADKEALADPDNPLLPAAIVTESDSCLHRCFQIDDVAEVRKHIDTADELIIVCPVYFAGPPSQMKALMDRMEPYYHSDLWKRSKNRRPMTLHVVGEGGDPHGYEPLLGCVKSAFGIAGFALERVLDWVGCIDDDGTITSDAKESIFNG